jgi:competence protein ComEC
MLNRFATKITLLLTITTTALATDPHMTAHIINVGQGAATLLEFPCGALLIDAGGQDDDSTEHLMTYLTNFFNGRSDLNSTLQAIYITHPHKDHTLALKRVVNAFTVRRFIENGQESGSGIENVKWVRSVATQRNITTRKILNSDVMASGNRQGLTNGEIDPLQCADCDPQIRILAGQWDSDPGWAHSEFDNKNNHSLVIRVDFGESSFLFDGDLEEEGIETILTYYRNGNSHAPLLDVDVFHVGHHGSYNGTTADFLSELTPVIAVVSVGKWYYGQNNNSPFTTWAYGHPRKVTLDLLKDAISGSRSGAVWIQAATAPRKFSQYVVRRRIYATAWDGNTQIRAGMHHDYVVARNN